MKKLLAIMFSLSLAVPITALAQGTLKIGTIDMQRAFKEYNKTKEAEAKMKDAATAAQKEINLWLSLHAKFYHVAADPIRVRQS